jgi:hypothetical protein
MKLELNKSKKLEKLKNRYLDNDYVKVENALLSECAEELYLNIAKQEK